MGVRLYKQLPRTGIHKGRPVCPLGCLKICITCRSEHIILMCCPLPFLLTRVLTLTVNVCKYREE